MPRHDHYGYTNCIHVMRLVPQAAGTSYKRVLARIQG